MRVMSLGRTRHMVKRPLPRTPKWASRLYVCVCVCRDAQLVDVDRWRYTLTHWLHVGSKKLCSRWGGERRSKNIEWERNRKHEKERERDRKKENRDGQGLEVERIKRIQKKEKKETKKNKKHYRETIFLLLQSTSQNQMTISVVEKKTKQKRRS